MASVYKYSNNRPLVICNKSSLAKELDESQMVPCVSLVTAWSIDSISSDLLNNLILFLLDKGCSYFVCVGTYAEQLHDFVDDLVLEQEGLLKNKPYSHVMTTYHDDESLDDVINFFINATEIWDTTNGGLIAILDDMITEDRKIKSYLIR